MRLLIEGVNPDKVIKNVCIRPLGWTLRYNYGTQGSLLAGLQGQYIFGSCFHFKITGQDCSCPVCLINYL
ncbi:MAG: hypothetical protein LBD80_00355 [Tannerella sp.]|nr:hypothetical protein [Tannerella sp.]